jgi:hypothetical protein
MTTALATVFAAPGAVTGYAAIAVAALMLALWLASIPLRDVSIRRGARPSCSSPSWRPSAPTAAWAAGGCWRL